MTLAVVTLDDDGWHVSPAHPAVDGWTCVECGRADTEGGRGPSSIVGADAVYRVELGEWLCRRHHRQRWAEYLYARRERLALIELSRVLGHAATRADLVRHRRDGVQLTFTWGSDD